MCLTLSPYPKFIETRLEKLNAGEGFSDQFEQEIIACCGASSGEPWGSHPINSPGFGLPWHSQFSPSLRSPGALRSYQLWVDSLKVTTAIPVPVRNQLYQLLLSLQASGKGLVNPPPPGGGTGGRAAQQKTSGGGKWSVGSSPGDLRGPRFSPLVLSPPTPYRKVVTPSCIQ